MGTLIPWPFFSTACFVLPMSYVLNSLMTLKQFFLIRVGKAHTAGRDCWGWDPLGANNLGILFNIFHFMTKRLFAQGLTGLLASSKLQSSSLHGMNSKASELFLMHHSKESPNHLIFNTHNT